MSSSRQYSERWLKAALEAAMMLLDEPTQWPVESPLRVLSSHALPPCALLLPLSQLLEGYAATCNAQPPCGPRGLLRLASSSH